MLIQNIRLTNFRILQAVNLDCSAHFNCIVGENGAGKTSLLEAMHYLSVGRSFRTKYLRHLIQYQAPNVSIACSVQSPSATHLPPHQISFSKSHQTHSKTLTLDGVPQANFSSITKLLPIQYIGVDSHHLFSSSAQYRRKFMNWGVFHVEPCFYPTWLQYCKTLRHRNVLIKNKSPKADLASWDHALSVLGQQIDAFRAQYITQLSQHIQELWKNFGFSETININYCRGWPENTPLATELTKTYHHDIKYGYTTSGAHRANLLFSCRQGLIKDVFSQGQQKLLSYICRLSQGLLMQQLTAINPIFVIDDITSEFDSIRVQQVLSILQNLGSQVFFSVIDENQIIIPNQQCCAMFHVEQGKIIQNSANLAN